MKQSTLITTAKFIFALTAICVSLIFLWTYAHEVSVAKSYTAIECNDSMTRVQCDHPYSGSIFWASISTVFIAGPLAIGGFVVGSSIMLYAHNRKEPHAKTD